jgi:hydroxymethylglutaryl-CoA lyase
MNGQSVRIVEVGPRDGLQSEPAFVSTTQKLELISRLASAGLRHIEATSFVSPKWVPQMADATAISACIAAHPNVEFSALTPNLKGLEAALRCGFQEVAVFAAASETFSVRNINCSIPESLKRFRPLMRLAEDSGVRVRGYVSCVLGCPYEGDVQPSAVRGVSEALLSLGCYEVSLGDTIGVGHPASVDRLFSELCAHIRPDRFAAHFHDTYGMAVANAAASLPYGIRNFDSSVSGLGGCPYAKGATGNVATEELVYLFHRLGWQTGVNLEALINCSFWISEQMGRPVGSKVARAIYNERRSEETEKVHCYDRRRTA